MEDAHLIYIDRLADDKVEKINNKATKTIFILASKYHKTSARFKNFSTVYY